MDLSGLKKIIVTVLVLIGLGVFGYNVFIKPPTPDISGLSVDSKYKTSGQDILLLANKLKNISIDQNFFSSELFKNLKDFSATLTPESQGRPNPFAPIGNDSGSLVNTQRVTNTSGTR